MDLDEAQIKSLIERVELKGKKYTGLYGVLACAISATAASLQ